MTALIDVHFKSLSNAIYQGSKGTASKAINYVECG